MESGNSSSMQSSSGGDDQDYDESNFSTTITTTNSNTSNMFVFSSTQHQPYLQQPPFGDSNFQSIIFWQQPQLGSTPGSSMPDPPPTTVTTSCSPSSTATNTFINPQPPPLPSSGGGSGNASTSTKNPRKRTRASRRAPTMVLTTDTTNFRAMVQEFTGIPSSPFSAAASPLLSRRLNDLFAPSATTTLGLTGPMPIRPVANATTSNLDRLITSGGYNANAVSSVDYPFSTITRLVPGSGLNIHDPGTNNPNPNPDMRYPIVGSSHFNGLLTGNEQQQYHHQQQMFSPVTQHGAFSGVRLESEPDPIGGSIPISSTSTNDEQDGN